MLVNVFVKENITKERFCFHNHLVDNSQKVVLLSCHDMVSLIVHYKKNLSQIYLNGSGQFICLLRQQFLFFSDIFILE